ncbi:hypothetical protein CsSME_00015264 [Camellia sinensis var. sinensis]
MEVSNLKSRPSAQKGKGELHTNGVRKKTLTVEEFNHVDAGKLDSDPTIERDLGAFLSAGVLTLRNNFLPRMDSPVTMRKIDTLKHSMKNLAAKKCNFVFSSR